MHRMPSQLEPLTARLKATWMAGDYRTFATYLAPGAARQERVDQAMAPTDLVGQTDSAPVGRVRTDTIAPVYRY